MLFQALPKEHIPSHLALSINSKEYAQRSQELQKRKEKLWEMCAWWINAALDSDIKYLSYTIDELLLAKPDFR